MRSIMHLQSALRKIALRAYPEGHRWYVPNGATAYHTRGKTPPKDIDLKNVRYLFLGGGTLPAGINLKHVQHLCLDGGTLPVGIDLKNVRYLYLDGGTLPEGIDLKNVEYIDWGGGTIEGLPSSWGNVEEIPYRDDDDISDISVPVLYDAMMHGVKIDWSYVPQVPKRKPSWDRL